MCKIGGVGIVIIFQSKELADMLLKEIEASPILPEGIGNVIVWQTSDTMENVVQYAYNADGRCCCIHGWSEADKVVLSDFMKEFVEEGSVRILDELPKDWVGSGV